MTELWQYLVIIFLIFAAAVYLVLHFIKSRRTKKACKNCALYKHADKVNETRNNQSPVSNQKLL
jgi:hypothetical protein